MLWTARCTCCHASPLTRYHSRHYRQVERLEVLTPRNSPVSHAKAYLKGGGNYNTIRVNVGSVESFDRQLQQAYVDYGIQPHERPFVKYTDSVNFTLVQPHMLPLSKIIGII